MKTSIKNSVSLLAFAAVLFCSPGLKAQIFGFQVDINTSALTTSPGNTNGPFFLDFQLNQGSSTLSNVATISNFTLTGGTPTSGTQFSSGPTVTGDLGSTISLTDNSSNPFNEFFQGFSAGTTHIKFNVGLTQNPGLTPDGFNIAILDSESGNPQIPTTASDGVSLVTVPIEHLNFASDIDTASSLSGVTVTITGVVPEPSSWALMLLGGAVLVMMVRLRRLKA